MHSSISVVVPAYNAERSIGETIESILNQTIPPTEVIVIDDGSLDGTAGVVRSFGARLKYERQENAGASAARNHGIALAKGEYIAFLDADDLWLPQKLEKQIALLERNPDLRWVYSDAFIFADGQPESTTRVGRHLKLWSGNVFEPLLLGNFIPSPTPVIHRAVFAQLNAFAQLTQCEDWEMWLRIAQYYPLGVVPEPLARYRLSKVSKSHSCGSTRRHEIMMGIVERAIQRYSHTALAIQNKARHDACIASAEAMIRKEEIGNARVVLRDAIHHRASAQALAYLAFTYCPVGSQRTLRDARRRILGIPSFPHD